MAVLFIYFKADDKKYILDNISKNDALKQLKKIQ